MTTQPAQVIQQFAVTVPAGTLEADPYTLDLAVGANMQVQAIRWQVPPGPRGNLGFALTSMGAWVFPSGGGWVTPDDDTDTWEVEDTMDSGAWALTAYNTGIYEHTVYLTFFLAPLAPDSSTTGPPTDLTGAVVTA